MNEAPESREVDKVGDAAEAMENPEPTAELSETNERRPSLEEGRIQVSMLRSRTSYASMAKRYFRGNDGKPPLDEVTVTALGSAISNAATVCAFLESTNTGIIKKIETSCADNDRSPKNDPDRQTRMHRLLPRITFVIQKHPDLKDEDSPAPSPVPTPAPAPAEA